MGWWVNVGRIRKGERVGRNEWGESAVSSASLVIRIVLTLLIVISSLSNSANCKEVVSSYCICKTYKEIFNKPAISPSFPAALLVTYQ
jgi:hypothetical protein